MVAILLIYMYIAGSEIVSISAEALDDPHGLLNTCTMNLKFLMEA